MTPPTAVLHGGPRDGDRVPLQRSVDVLKVPVEDEGDVVRYPDPPTEMRVAWYRRAVGSTTDYIFDCLER